MILHRTPLVALLALPNSNMREEKINSGLSCKNRLTYPVVNGISGSLSCIPFSKAQDSGFHKQNWYPGFQNSYSSTWGDKRSHRAKLQMAYCDEKKQNGWKSTKTQPTDVTLFVGMAFAQVSHWMFLRCETACPLPLSRPQLQCLYVFLIRNVTFSLVHVNIAPSLQQQLLLNALKRNFSLFKTKREWSKTDFKFLTSPHQNSIKREEFPLFEILAPKLFSAKKLGLLTS